MGGSSSKKTPDKNAITVLSTTYFVSSVHCVFSLLSMCTSILCAPHTNLLSKSYTPQEKDTATLELKRQRDRLTKYRKQLDVVIARETEICKDLIRQKKKDRALIALKKKKFQEGLLIKTEGQMETLDTLIRTIDFASQQQEVFAALKIGKEALDEINKQCSIEDVEQLMDESAEALAQQEEISRILSGSLKEQDISEEDLMAELDEYEENAVKVGFLLVILYLSWFCHVAVFFPCCILGHGHRCLFQNSTSLYAICGVFCSWTCLTRPLVRWKAKTKKSKRRPSRSPTSVYRPTMLQQRKKSLCRRSLHIAQTDH